MARRATLGGSGLNPFGGAGVDFGAFDITNTNRESELILTRVEVQWEAGQADDTTYLAALKAYAGTLDANTSQRLNADARVETMTYRVERGVLTAQVDAGTKTNADLLAYDKSKLTGLNADSEEYRQRLNQYQSTQNQVYNDLEQPIVQQYNDGKMTTAQLNAWYVARRADPALADNADIRKSIDTRLHDLEGRMTQERDSDAVDKYNNGKMSPAAFISYATAARARYAPNTSDFKDWSNRITDAHDKTIEQGLLYRYDLSQKYAQLAKFVASSKAPTGSAGSAGGTRTTKSTRTILGTDGKWHTVTTEKTVPTKGRAATGPSKSELAAYHQRQIEVADAKKQMAEIAKKVAGVGGFASSTGVKGYYEKQLAKVVKGSSDWYQIQGKIDSLNDRIHAEKVDSLQGIRISYPKGAAPSGGSSAKPKAKVATTGGGAGSSPRVPAKSDTASIGIDDFMQAIAHVESGGRYTATNKSSGAHGKYQIMPANWPGWAAKYLGDAHAAQTPENQEKVARGKFTDLYKWLGDWRAVAHWWLTGGSDKNKHLDPGSWSSSSAKYVNNVMAGLGKGPVSGSTLASNAKASGASSPGGTRAPGTSVTAANKATKAVESKTGPLTVITGYQATGRGGTQPVYSGANFPKNLDSSAFTKFYTQYEQAFKSGATEFSVDTGNGTVHYFIGDDTVERRDGMRYMDDLKINLYKERMGSYAGTPSEIVAAGAFDNAIEAAAKHELMILDTYEQKGTTAGGGIDKSPNPIAAGIALLDKTKAGVEDHLKLADEAFKRGDLTTAYTQYQMAAKMRGDADGLIARYGAVAANDVAAIERAYGVKAEEALGGGAKQLNDDLARLDGFGTELETSLGKGTEGLAELQKIVRKDAHGNPIFDQGGAGGQLMLSDGYHFEIKDDGTVEAKPTPTTGYDPQTGKPTKELKGMVRVDYLSGNSTVSAFVKYNVGTVGYVTTADGQRIPLTGKTFTRRRADGSDELWVEDPLHPGRWSSTPIAYKAPQGFKAVAGKNGQTVFEYQGLGGDGSAGFTYHLEFDQSSGTYAMFRSKPGGLFSQEVVDEPLGSMTSGSIAESLFKNSGFGRDFSQVGANDAAFSDMDSPFVGGTAEQYKQWRDNFQTPFRAKPGQGSADLQESQLGQRAAANRIAPRDSTIHDALEPDEILRRNRSLGLVNENDQRASLLDEQAIRRQQQAKTAATLTALKPLPKAIDSVTAVVAGRAAGTALGSVASLLTKPKPKTAVKPAATKPAPAKKPVVHEAVESPELARRKRAAAQAAANLKAKQAATSLHNYD